MTGPDSAQTRETELVNEPGGQRETGSGGTVVGRDIVTEGSGHWKGQQR